MLTLTPAFPSPYTYTTDIPLLIGRSLLRPMLARPRAAGARPAPSKVPGAGRAQQQRRRSVALPAGVANNEIAETERQRPLVARVVEVGLAGARRREVALGADHSTTAASPAPQQRAAQHVDNDPSSDRSSPLAVVRDFFLPRGWPHSVTPGEPAAAAAPSRRCSLLPT